MKSGYQKRIVLCCFATLVGLVFLKDSWASSPRTAAAAVTTDIASSSIISAPTPAATTKPLKTVARNNVRTYTNAAFDFSLTYPSDLSVAEYDEGGGTKSIVFQKSNEHVGFQMFITPDDADDPLTPADIELDFPTLDMQGIESLTIGTGTSAVAFGSEVPDFGPTRNLWFVHDGYLFEIVTYSNLGPWLAQILTTIRFP